MTATTLDPTTIEDLDFEPSCESPHCREGHPTATHIQLFFGAVRACRCRPPSQLICDGCVKRIVDHPDSSIWLCRNCGALFSGWKHDWFRIEPLPW